MTAHPNRPWLTVWVGALLACLMVTSPPARAQEDAPAPAARTASDPAIPVRQLEHLVKPLTVEELKVEADAWMALLKAKVSEISQARIVADAAAAPSTDPPADAPASDAPASDRAAQLEAINQLRFERTALIERLNIVLAQLTLKGGEAEPYTKYVAAVDDQAIAVHVQDVSATWIAVRSWATSPDGGLKWLRNIGLFLGTLLVFWILSIVAGRAAARIVRAWKKSSALLRDFVVGIVRKAIMILGFILALTFLQVNINPLLAAIGGAAFVVAFALQGTLSNFAAGILILAYRPFDIGDVVDVAGVSGVVDSMSLVSTTIKSFDNKKIIVPNGSIWGGVITNATAHDTRRVDMTFGIAYGDDIDKARDVIESIVTAHELVLKDPAPVVKMHEMADSSVKFICRPWTRTGDYWTVYWDIQRAVKQRFDAEGITIPFPQQDVYMHQVPAKGDA